MTSSGRELERYLDRQQAQRRATLQAIIKDAASSRGVRWHLAYDRCAECGRPYIDDGWSLCHDCCNASYHDDERDAIAAAYPPLETEASDWKIAERYNGERVAIPKDAELGEVSPPPEFDPDEWSNTLLEEQDFRVNDDD